MSRHSHAEHRKQQHGCDKVTSHLYQPKAGPDELRDPTAVTESTRAATLTATRAAARSLKHQRAHGQPVCTGTWPHTSWQWRHGRQRAAGFPDVLLVGAQQPGARGPPSRALFGSYPPPCPRAVAPQISGLAAPPGWDEPLAAGRLGCSGEETLTLPPTNP